jgi:hypothetical protein
MLAMHRSEQVAAIRENRKLMRIRTRGNLRIANCEGEEKAHICSAFLKIDNLLHRLRTPLT